jgi:hypothetical protein
MEWRLAMMTVTGLLLPSPSTSIASRSSTLVNAYESLIIPLCSSIEQV